MRLFVLLSRVPYPLQKGDRLRAFNQIKELSKHHEIILCALNDAPIHPKAMEKLSPYCKSIEIIHLSKSNIYFNLINNLLFTQNSLQVAYFYNKSVKKKIHKLIEKYQPEHIYCQLIRVSEYVKDVPIPKTLDYMDALARGMERRIENGSVFLRPFLKLETIRLKRYEHEIFDYFDNKTIISDQDRKLIVHAANHHIAVVPNGVDFKKYYPTDIPKEFDIIFTGNMGYPPNVMAAEYLVTEIMPIVWKTNPNINIAIVGANPAVKVKAMASKKVIVTGFVADMNEYYGKAKIFIAPMLIGTGLQNKLLEAMAAQLPCITSTLANNALGGEHNKNIIIAEQPQQYAEQILNLLTDKELAIRIAQSGHQFVKQRYSWENSTNILHELISKTIKNN